VDETPPVLQLKCDPTNNGIMVLKQGDVYRECMIDIADSNAEEYMRNLKIRYSKPLPQSCLETVGEFYVNYTVGTPWTSPPFVGVQRKVVVEDLDECSSQEKEHEILRDRGCGIFIPRCDLSNGAKCTNTVGSYSCECPKDTEGDGFIKLEESHHVSLPQAYRGGTGCRDISKPIIKLNGPNPKVFKVAKPGVLTGVLEKGEEEDDDNDLQKRKNKYFGDIMRMIKLTSGAELCATPSSSNVVQHSCAIATDTSYLGTVDISERVTIGKPVSIEPPNRATESLWWRVAYNVKDDTGNQAETQYRFIQVIELTLEQIEDSVPQEKYNAFRSAYEEEQAKKNAAALAASAAVIDKKPKCPVCQPPTPCPEQSEPVCDNICTASATSDTPSPPSLVCASTLSSDMVNMFEQIISTMVELVPFIVFFVSICFVLGIISFFTNKVFNTEKINLKEKEREEELAKAITYHSSPSRTPLSQKSGLYTATPSKSVADADMPPPTSSLSFTSPIISRSGTPAYSSNMSATSTPAASTVRFQEDIYQNMSPITPSKSGVTPRPMGGSR